MRVLLVHDYATATGGAELQMLALREGLRQRGHDARLFSTTARHVPADLLADYHCFGTTDRRLQKLTQTINPAAYLALRRALREFRPDVVHVRLFMWQLSPMILPLLKDVPALYQAAMYKAICPTGRKLLPNGEPCREPAGLACLRHRCLSPLSWPPLMLQRQLWQRWHKVFDAVVVLSEAMRRQFEAEGIAPVEIVHNGVPARPMRPPLTSPPTIAFAGRLSWEKGWEVLLEAVRRVADGVPEVRLLLAGGGPDRSRVAETVDRLGLRPRTTIMGHLPRPDLERAFDAAWVQAVPSLWQEPFGNVTTEAMMRGTAVVASDVGGPAEIIGGDMSGLLVPPGDAGLLAVALEHVLSDPARAEAMGRAGHERAKRSFSEAACLDRFIALYGRLVSQTSSKRLEHRSEA